MSPTMKKTVKICMNLLNRPKISTRGNIFSQGDCAICKFSVENVRCSGYKPINIITYDVKEG